MDQRKARIGELLDELRGSVFVSETDVQRRLINPCLTELGWTLGRTNTEVWVGFDDQMAAFWNYSPRLRRMRRDYILCSDDGTEEIHVEAKKNWPGWTELEFGSFLKQVNHNDWSGTQNDGCAKDLAIVLWGTASRGVRRAAIIDEHRLLVLDDDGGWRMNAHVRLFEDSLDDVWDALALLAPSAIREIAPRAKA
jgi:hypothetical protein